MKKLHLLLVKSFIGPFLATFCISIFLMLMQFLWKYIGDLVGKGLEWYIILEFIFYSIPYLIPRALPLAVLLSTIMVFGNLGERYELVAIKSAGISLGKGHEANVLCNGYHCRHRFLFFQCINSKSQFKLGSFVL